MEASSLKEYNAAKLAVKAWEREYRAQNSCRPDRRALAAASSELRAAYSTYYRLRKVFASDNQQSVNENTQSSNSFGLKQSEKIDDGCKYVSPKSSEQRSDDLGGSKEVLGKAKTTKDCGLPVSVSELKERSSELTSDKIETEGNLPGKTFLSSTPASNASEMHLVSDQSSETRTSSADVGNGQEVFGRFLNRPKKDLSKKVERAPLSDLYSKLAQNMRESFLASPTMPPVKLSLKSRASKPPHKLKNSLEVKSSPTPNSEDATGTKGESISNETAQLDGKNISQEPKHETPESNSNIEGGIAGQDLADRDDADGIDSLDIFKKSFKIRGAVKNNTAHSINLMTGVALNSSRLSGNINSEWVKRCSKSLGSDDEVIYDFSEKNRQLSSDDFRLQNKNEIRKTVSLDHEIISSGCKDDYELSSLKLASAKNNDPEAIFQDSVSKLRTTETNLTISPPKLANETVSSVVASCEGISSCSIPNVKEFPCVLGENSQKPLSPEVLNNKSLTLALSDGAVCTNATPEPDGLCSEPLIAAPADTESAITSEHSCGVVNGRSLKRKAEESLDELEESGKIVSVWPPPKKKRVSRITKNSDKEIDRHKLTIKARKIEAETANGNLKKSMQVRVRRSVRKPNGVSSNVRTTEVKTRAKSNYSEEFRAEQAEGSDEFTCSPPNENGATLPEYDEQLELEKNSTGVRRRKFMSKEDRLADKVKRGTLNQNFVKIDLKKKTYARGKKTMTGSKYRRMEWKRKQGLKSASGKLPGEAKKNLTCHKCGDFGHWAARCPGKMPKMDYTEASERTPVTFLTLEEAENMARGIKTSQGKVTTRLFFPSSSASPSQATREPDNPLVEYSSEKNDEDISDSIPAIHGDEDVVPPPNDDDEENDDDDDEDGSDSPLTATDDYEFDETFDDDEMDQLEAAALEEESFPSTLPENSQASSEQSFPSSLKSDTSSDEQFNCHKRKTAEPLLPESITSCPQEVLDTLLMFGHSSFRPGQETAILRILQGKSTLLVLSTGSGKSLCYQLPAYLYAMKQNCITLCVSPLVSLMEDQVTGLPAFLRAVCLHTNQTAQQRSKALETVRSGKAHILLVSPEAVVASGAGGVLGTLMKDLPTVGFACVDEAHCVSQWSHNFRPSYLRVCSVLRHHLRVRTILGLTATARHETTLSIARHLKVDDLDSGIIRGSSVPSNLLLSVSRDANRNEALIQLLHGDRFASCESIIVYCTRRDECERVATLLRSQLLTTQKIDVKANLKRNRGISLDAEAYHAGLSATRRRQIQNKFMSGKLRIVVATVAFGMGIDKSDVRAIIHYNMPKNLESYVQEIGRAGRDGLLSQCHLFLDCLDGRDVQELKRFIFVNSVDRVTVRKLLERVFHPCVCTKLNNLNSNDQSNTNENRSCPKHEVALSVADLVESLDIPEENILTLLCYLELRDENLLQLLPSVYGTCTITCYGGAAQLCSASKACPPLAVAIAKDNQRGVSHQTSNSITFPVVQVAAQMGWNSGIVKRELKALEWMTAGGSVRPSGVKVEFSALSFHLMVRGDLTDDEQDTILDELHSRAVKQETDQLKQLQYTHQTLRAASHASILLCCDQVDENRCTRLKAAIARYFEPNSTELEKVLLENDPALTPALETSVRQDVRSLLSTHTDQTWTARAVARVFHGIQSPNFPANVWGRVKRIWRAHINVPFKQVLTIAQQEIIKWRRL